MPSSPLVEELPRQSTPTTFDASVVMIQVDGDLELLGEISELFFEDYPQMLDDISDAISSDDAESLWQAAHALKGSASNFAAETVVGSAFRLESLGRDGGTHGAQEIFSGLSRDLVQLEAELRAFVDRAH